MIQNLISMFSWRYPSTLVYMLQSTEYKIGDYLTWLRRTKDFKQVARRRTLNRTRAARLLLLGLSASIAVQVIVGIVCIVLGALGQFAGGIPFGIAIIVLYPVLWPYLIILPLLFGRYFVTLPKQRELIAASEKIFAAHPGTTIAVAGSYGKTTMKELLATVLAEKLSVAATPGNKNVAITHALFARRLTGKEGIVIIEYGEGAPGDVARFAKVTHPNRGIITGLAPAHLDRYKTVEAAGTDIFSLAQFVPHDYLYVSSGTATVEPFIQPDFQVFTNDGALGWSVDNVVLSVSGTSFTMKKSNRRLELTSGLVGHHQVATIAFVASLALELGLSEKQVQAGVRKTIPFEHRMQPYALGGAWIIDDTYNGNLEGIRVGTALLAALAATRKIYVTPGLVDQGHEVERVHREMGGLIAAAKPDIVVLMQNSTTAYIQQGLEDAKFRGAIQIEYQPLEFYTNLEQFIAAGDVVLMQNDWTDNYA